MNKRLRSGVIGILLLCIACGSPPPPSSDFSQWGSSPHLSQIIFKGRLTHSINQSAPLSLTTEGYHRCTPSLIKHNNQLKTPLPLTLFLHPHDLQSLRESELLKFFVGKPDATAIKRLSFFITELASEYFSTAR